MISSRKCLIIAATTAAAAIPSSAQAMRIGVAPTPAPTPVGVVAHAATQHVDAPGAARAGSTASEGFRWDDAGLGAAGMFIILGSASVAARRLRGHGPVLG